MSAKCLSIRDVLRDVEMQEMVTLKRPKKNKSNVDFVPVVESHHLEDVSVRQNRSSDDHYGDGDVTDKR